MKKQAGFIPVYYDSSEDKVFLQIDATDQPLLFQSSLPQGVGSNDIGLDRGQLGATRLVQFERYGNKILLKQLNTEYRASADNPAEKASIDEAFADSVIAGFTIVASNDDSVLIDYTAQLFSDIHGIAERLKSSNQGSFKPDASRSGVYMEKTKAFPLNTELEALVTFGGNGTGSYLRSVTPDADSVTVHLHHSFVALPDDGYEPRAFHPFSGYWKHSWQDYSAPITEPLEQAYIRRHRLAKKDPGAAISEAVEPIVYYLDPGIPEPVMSALKDGASWWNQAFEAAGYKDAFQVKVLPPDADPMDVRYNVINWVHRATRGWSYGSSVVDPRTGEIIKGHVTLGSLRVRQDYLIALGLTSPFGQDSNATTAQKEMALARIRQLSAHEVGHTLGIAHNFAASENGRESVMDYPHPKIDIENGELSLADAYDVGMGQWDNYVIAYGYQDFADDTNTREALESMVVAAREQGLKYKSDADVRASRHASADGHLWDNGENPLAQYDHLMQVRKLALSNMGLDTLQTGESLSSLENALVPVYLLHRFQLEAVAKQVAGIHYQYENKGDYAKPRGVKMVAPETQVEAMTRLIDASTAQVLAMPDALLDLITPPVFAEAETREQFNGRMGRVFDPISAAESAAAFSLQLLLHPERLNRLVYQHSRQSSVPGVDDLIRKIFSVHFYRQQRANSNLIARLQLVALQSVMQTLQGKDTAPEVKLAITAELMTLTEWLEDEDDVPGYRALEHYLEHYWETGEWPLAFSVKPLPPGSPI
ncbi:zinc-dependent metalloprotease [Alteromonas gilva]|uniref:Zinc-dependent metalloprotease n=1 Tax=Alteromonas gilva TaxID=2987522 RepID=A0ABT5L125_9ALTE|nr:zinc-dependent metalloprotease [Alteromonas gilva]MDC8830725.1 zinc-dependent metalloprotease [Alteromonas gilva]